MIKKQSASEIARRIAPTVVVQTKCQERVQKPDHDPELFVRAASQALSEAVASDFGSVRFGSVTELIVPRMHTDQIDFLYLWEFTANDPVGGK